MMPGVAAASDNATSRAIHHASREAKRGLATHDVT